MNTVPVWIPLFSGRLLMLPLGSALGSSAPSSAAVVSVLAGSSASVVSVLAGSSTLVSVLSSTALVSVLSPGALESVDG